MIPQPPGLFPLLPLMTSLLLGSTLNVYKQLYKIRLLRIYLIKDLYSKDTRIHKYYDIYIVYKCVHNYLS